IRLARLAGLEERRLALRGSSRSQISRWSIGAWMCGLKGQVDLENCCRIADGIQLEVLVVSVVERTAAAELRSGGVNMPRELDWTDTEEIGIQLQEMFPDTDPYSVRFTDLHKWVVQLPGFVGDPAKSNEGILEAIQTAWHEEYEDAKGA